MNNNKNKTDRVDEEKKMVSKVNLKTMDFNNSKLGSSCLLDDFLFIEKKDSCNNYWHDKKYYVCYYNKRNKFKQLFGKSIYL